MVNQSVGMSSPEQQRLTLGEIVAATDTIPMTSDGGHGNGIIPQDHNSNHSENNSGPIHWNESSSDVSSMNSNGDQPGDTSQQASSSSSSSSYKDKLLRIRNQYEA